MPLLHFRQKKKKNQCSGNNVSSFFCSLSIPILLAQGTQISLLMEFRGLFSSKPWVNHHEKHLSPLSIAQETVIKKQLSPTPGGKFCLEKASTGARVWLRHQDKVLTPVPLNRRLQRRVHLDSQRAAPTAGTAGAPGQRGERAKVSQGQGRNVPSPPLEPPLGCSTEARHGEGQRGCSAGLRGARCCSVDAVVPDAVVQDAVVSDVVVQRAAVWMLQCQMLRCQTLQCQMQQCWAPQCQMLHCQMLHCQMLRCWVLQCRVLPQTQLCLNLSPHTRIPLPFQPLVLSWAGREHRQKKEVSAISQAF